MSTTYPSSLTDEQWALLEQQVRLSGGGRRPTVDFRRILDGIFYRNGLYVRIKGQVDGTWELEVVSRPPGQKGWVLLPRRWVVERTFAWVGRCRINSKEYERLARSSEAQVQISMVRLMLNRLKPSGCYPEFRYKRPAA